ncbi:uncharacterized protein I303_107200 [Kwoniella dejecticola CBS 10117]|uniref:Uncharacterized protein n=1 Tax=Kwoniella dejecticola CBS 10117 TaxID=1296121 RepID=A0A1A5ZZ04_9TREE|nr:uncharacterized protein I303_06601 [Kwoniella dejecticola CBS 10117]OBR83042.1 hypothetical protein I303_06601 [Kwoniella dejecticola CBS 10117]
MSLNHHLPKKVSLAPKRHHGFQFLLFLLGLLLPPIAVAVRFGIGTDFFINVFLCICGYFPCHFHNFYIQNIRNNQNRARTPKWAIKYGLVDNTDRERRLKKSQWSKRYDERNAHSTLRDQELEEGEEGTNYDPTTANPEEVERRRNEGLWTGDDEEYYNEDQAPNQRNWHYPANFEGTVGDGRSYKRGKTGSSGDRWERAARRSSNASSGYPPAAATDSDVPKWGEDYGRKKGSKSKKAGKKDHQHDWANNSEYDNAWAQSNGSSSSLNNSRSNGRANGNANSAAKTSGRAGGDPNWDHEF